MPRLVRTLEAPPERRSRTRRGRDIDLRWDPDAGTAELAIELSDGEAVIGLSRDTLRHLLHLAEEADRALGGDGR